METTNYDFIGIGDTVVDAFIHLQIGEIEESAKGPLLCMPYGAKIPYTEATIIPAVGNSANGAVSAARLGLRSALVTNLGKDAHGDTCVARLTEEHVSSDFISQEEGKKTNYHYVLWFGNDRTILIKHETFTPRLPDIGSPTWIYLSSLGEYAKNLHFDIATYLETHPEIKLAFQPGTFQLGIKQELADLYKVTHAVCMNKEEAQALLDTAESDFKILLDGLAALGPKIVLITDGPHGSYMKHDNTYFFMPIYPDIAPPLERTGAGDAFFSTFISYLAQGYDPSYAITRAPINSMNVVQHVGAQEGLLSKDAIEDYLKKAPADYKLTILN